MVNAPITLRVDHRSNPRRRQAGGKKVRPRAGAPRFDSRRFAARLLAGQTAYGWSRRRRVGGRRRRGQHNKVDHARGGRQTLDTNSSTNGLLIGTTELHGVTDIMTISAQRRKVYDDTDRY